LGIFILRYENLFRSKTHTYSDKVTQYLRGLFQSEKRNIEKMCEKVEDSNMQNLQHFISNSPWDADAVMRRVASDTDKLFRENGEKTGLLIDESGWKKQGKKSVGVARQYLGSLGKVDNGQVGVFLSLVNGDKVGIINTRLYLPAEWTDDRKRCIKAGIPEDKIVFKTKCELGLEMVLSARREGIRFEWLGGDGFYGNDSKLRYGLDDAGEFYILDIHSDQYVYMTDPCPYIPEKKPGKGRPPCRYQSDIKGITVESLVRGYAESEWKEYCFRSGTKGEKRRKVIVTEVQTWNGEDSRARKEKLIASKNTDGTEVKYSLCNDRYNRYKDCDLLYMQMQRYWIERSLQDAKSELGMAEYQVRTWTAWHHHIALTMLALLFMTEQKLGNREHIPLLSCSDIKFILANTLPQKANTKEEILNLVHERHIRRQYDIARFVNMTK
jgi:SRSO17 transposase